MAKKSFSPIMTWMFWSILVLGAFLTVTWEYFVAGFSADTSKITWLILGFFIYGFAASLRVAFYLEAEFKSLKVMDVDQRVTDADASDASAMFDAAMERIRRGDRIEVRNLITAYGAKLKGRVDNIGVVAGMLITIGLLGTVVGLIITVTGLDQVLQSNSADFASMKAGLNKTVSGMGTAFYTTFFGALLGGVVLKVLSAEMKKSAQVLVADALRFSELFIAPQFQKKASESLVALEERITVLQQQLSTLGGSFGEVIETIDSKQSVLASGLGNLVERVEQANRDANERADALTKSFSGSMEETSRQTEERLKAFINAMEQSGDKTSQQSAALVAAITESIQSVNASADERLNVISNSIGAAMTESGRHTAEQLEAVAGSVSESISETNRMADERLKALLERSAVMLEETNRVADERLKVILESAEAVARASSEKADAQLAGFVDNVEKAVDKARKDAESRLGAKASDLAGKLNEAASMLSGLVNSAESDEVAEKPRTEGE